MSRLFSSRVAAHVGGVWFAVALTVARSAAAQEAPLKIVVTIKPVHALALQVLDGVAKPVLVIDGATSPHTYALKPSDAKLFNDADVVVRVSEALEPFTTRIVRSLPKTIAVVTLDQAAGVRMLPRRTGTSFEGHKEAGGKHNHAHDHGNGKAALDGHLWLDPANGRAIIAELARVATAKRPQARERIAANAAAATKRIEALEAHLNTVLTPVKGRPYVVFHDALQYFEARYGLTPVGSITVDPEVPPSAKRLKDLRNKIKTLTASCVFAEPGYEQKIVKTVIEDTTAKSGVLDPEALSIEAGPDAYDQLLRRLADGLRGCLAPPA